MHSRATILSAPKSFWGDLSLYGRIYEAVREFARWLGEHDFFVRIDARRSVLGLATTEETADRLMEESRKAGESGETYALRTARNAAAALERRAGPGR